MKRTLSLLGTLILAASFPANSAQAATYYISPSGLNANAGSADAPWLTFSHAIHPTRAWCGDTLVLLDGTYGNGTATGKLDIADVTCTEGSELTVRAQNQRKAKIFTGAWGKAIRVRGSAYIVVDGLYGRAGDDPASTNSGEGQPMRVETSHHITVRNSLFRNPNRYANTAAFGISYSQDILSEDNEVYVFHRHCHSSGAAERVTLRRVYCNPRGGAIPGGIGAQHGLNRADSLFSLYPCKDCTIENSIADGTTSALYLSEMNATYTENVPISGNKILGSICYRCNHGNGIYANPRNNVGLNHSPQNTTIRDVAFVDYNSPSSMIRCTDCVNATMNHITGLGLVGGKAGSGISADDLTTWGVTPDKMSVTITNSHIANVTGAAYRVASGIPYTGARLNAYNNASEFSPALPGNWTNTSMLDPQLGACKVWVPDGSPLKGVASDGKDIGATILYRYIDGALTNVPLWDTATGEFPHGATDLDGTNAVAGDSLFDFHKRINVNTGGCPFPADYGSKDADAPLPPANLQVI